MTEKNHDCVTNYIKLILQGSSINLTIKRVKKLQEKLLFTFSFASNVYLKKITQRKLSIQVYKDSTRTEHTSSPSIFLCNFFERNR